MALPKPLTKIFQYIEQNQDKFLNRLRNAIAIQSVPTSERYDSIIDMINWTNDLLKSFKVETELRNIQDESYTSLNPLPPVLLGNLVTGCCPNKATVLIYGHLDVKDAIKCDGWKNEPFHLFEENGFLCARGVLDKCSLVAWLNAIDAYHSLGIDFPVNIKFIFESLGSQWSAGLKNLLLTEKDKFLAHIDYICVSKGSWIQPEIPCIINSSKGICCFSVEVENAIKNLDSDICGGMVQEAMNDLLYVLKSLTDEKGNLDISSIKLEVEPISDEESQIYKQAKINMNNFLNSLGAHCLSHNGDKFEILKHRLSLPTITIHGIKSSCVEPTDSEIPGKVTSKVSIRTIPSQTPEKVFQAIKDYLQIVWLKFRSNNKLRITLEKCLDGWRTDVTHDHFQVGVKAFKYIYEMDPWFLTTGCIFPAVNILTQIFERNLILLPIGPGEKFDINENFESVYYYNAAKVFSAYLYEMGELPRVSNKSSTSFASCISCPSVAEACVCGRFGEKIEAASGDAEKCICTDLLCQPKPTTKKEICACPTKASLETKNEKAEGKHAVEILEIGKSVEFQTPLHSMKNEEDDTILHSMKILEHAGAVELELLSSKHEDDSIIHEIEISEEDELVKLPPSSISTNCKCPLAPAENFTKPPIGEIISLISNVSAISRDPTPVIEFEKTKKDITPSADTLKCVCTPKLFKNATQQKSITTERQQELMRSMRFVESEISGISAGESEPNIKTTRMNVLGCVCPEKSTETVFEETRQIERMFCPIKDIKKEQQCTKGGRRKHHIIGPAPIEEGDSEISLGPLSHCSCSTEELIIIPSCDCDKKDGTPYNTKDNIYQLPVNLEDEVD